MTRVDFYFNAPSKYAVALKLVIKATGAGARVLVYSRNSQVCRDIDAYFWEASPFSFVPHVSCQHPLAVKSPIIIGEDAGQLIERNVLINLDGGIPADCARFERVLEIVSENPEDRELSRSRYRYYKDNGFVLQTHDLKA